MRTNIEIDDELIEEAFRLTSARTKKELVHLALTEFIKTKKKKDLLDLNYELRRQGITVRNTIDCLIAASAIEHDLLLLHDDRDFEAISIGTSLNQIRV